MDRFAEALLNRQANTALPAEDDWFAPLLGDWEFDYQDRSGRHLKSPAGRGVWRGGTDVQPGAPLL